jgi:hypothetical protein
LALSAAAYDAAFGVFHLLFWRLFRWPGSLSASGTLNAAITQTLNAVLSYVFFVFAAAALLAPSAALFWAGTGFWALRTVLQPALFRLAVPVNIAMTVLFALGAAVHAAAALGS